MTVQEFFNGLETGATWSAGVAFKRSNPLPLDRYSVFDSYTAAQEYAASNVVAYPGQIVAVVNKQSTESGEAIGDTAIYYLAPNSDQTGFELKPIAASEYMTAELQKKVDKITNYGLVNIVAGTDTDEGQYTITAKESSSSAGTTVTVYDKDTIDTKVTEINTDIDTKVDKATGYGLTKLSEASGVVTAETNENGTKVSKKVYTQAQTDTLLNNKLNQVDAGNGINVTAKSSNKQTVSVKAKTGADNLVVVDTNGVSVSKTTVKGFTDVTITSDNTDDTVAKKYVIKQGGAEIGTIDIPKDMVVSAGTVETYTTSTAPTVGGSKLAAGTYIVLTLANAGSDKIYIPADSLIEYVTSGSGTNDAVKIEVSADHKVTATLSDGAVTEAKIGSSAVTTAKIKDASVTAAKLATDSVVTAKIKDANVTKAKLATDVTTSLDLADSAVQGVSLESGTSNGTLKLTVDSTVTDNVKVTGINNAAYKDVAATVTTSGTNLPTEAAVAAYVADMTAIYRYTE